MSAGTADERSSGGGPGEIKNRFMQAEAECERLTNLAIEQQSLREADAERSGRKHKFGSKEDFLERVRWFVDTCRARAEDGSTGGQAPESVKQNARSVLEQWRESLDLISGFVAGK